MDNFGMYGTSPFPVSPTAAAERVTAFLRKVYGWMCAGLAVTALVAGRVGKLLQRVDAPGPDGS